MTRLRYIDAQTGDYAISDGEFSESAGIASHVVIRLRTPRGSFLPAPNFGNRLYTLRKFGDDAEKQVASYVKEALADLVARGSIKDLAVVNVTFPVAGRVSYQVHYKDISRTRNVVTLTNKVGG